MKLNLNLDVMDVLHLGSRPWLKWLGVTHETRHLGELELGLWRRTVRPRAAVASVETLRRLVVIPGLGDSPFSWIGEIALVWPTLRAQFDEVVWIDFPAFSGLKKRKRGFDSIDGLENAVFDVLDSLRPETLLGHSLGGWLSASYARRCATGVRPQATARRHYEGPRRMVLINPGGYFRDEEHRRSWEGRFREAKERGFEGLRPALFHREPRWFKWIAQEWGAFLSREEILAFIESVKESHYLTTGQLGEIRAKSWVIWGTGDTLMGPGVGEAWVKAIQSGGAACEGVEIEEAGHGPHIEQPLKLAKQLRLILRQSA